MLAVVFLNERKNVIMYIHVIMESLVKLKDAAESVN